jgi:diguanylate cyclase (GGDEF)-like protein
MIKTLKGRTALAAALFAGLGILLVTSLQSQLSERSVTGSTVLQHEATTSRVAVEVDMRLRMARAALSEFASNMPGSLLANADELQNFMVARVGLQRTFETLVVYGVDGRMIAARPAMAHDAVAAQGWFAAALDKTSVIGQPVMSRLRNEWVVPITYRIHDEAGRLRAIAVGTLPLNHEQLTGASGGAAYGAGRQGEHFVLLTREGIVVAHPQPTQVGRPADLLGPAAAMLRAGLRTPGDSLVGPDHQGRGSLYTFRQVPLAGWTLAGVISNDAARSTPLRLSRQMLAAGGAIALLLIPAMWLLVSRMLRPIDELRAQMRQLKQGWNDTPLRSGLAGATLELQQLADDFAGMAQARHAVEQALQQEKERAEVTLQSIGDAVIATDATGAVTGMNRAAERLLERPLGEALGRPFADVVTACDEHSGLPLPDLARWAIREGRTVSMLHGIATPGRRKLLPVDTSAAPIRNAAGATDGAVIVVRNLAAEHAAAQELLWHTHHDALTGLGNRTAYEQALNAIFKSGDRSGMHAVIMMDLDQFKIVNDTCGHAGGDELLRQLAQIVLRDTRKTDLVARLGGDEFAVVLYQCPADQAMRVAETLRRAVADWRFQWQGQTFPVAASIGVVSVDESFTTAADIEKAADMACFMAKRTGRNRICLHSSKNQAVETMRTHMQLVSRIQNAIDGDRLRLFAQPIRPVDPDIGHGVHFEVLVRMLDEAGKMVSPGEFLPAAERFGLMDQLDRWVLRNSVAACARRFGPDRWDELDTVSVNFCALTLRDPSLGDHILETLARHGMPPQRLCMEITETAALESLDVVRALLERLRSHGVRVALDDFGVGMTSLSQLRDLPVDVLKIDGSFVKNIHHDPVNSEMVDAIQRIALRLDMQTVAECVERPEELAHLRGLGVQFVQGYLLGRPGPIDAVLAAPAVVPAVAVAGGVVPAAA